MTPIDPKDHTTKKETESLLKKSRELKEKARATSIKLNELKEQSGKMKDAQQEAK